MDRESEQLQQIKSAPPGADFVLETRRVFEMAEKGRKMTLEGLCVSRIIHDKKFAVLHNSVNQLPASLVQLLFDEAISLLEKDSFDAPEEWDDDHQALLEQLLLTGHITKLKLRCNCYYKAPFVSWLILTAVKHCPKLEHLECEGVEFCLSLENTCVLRKKRDEMCEEILPVVPLERMQHLTRLLLWTYEAHGDDLSAADLVRVVEALPKLEYLDCWRLLDYEKQMSPELVALVQPVLERNKRELEVKSLAVRLPDLKVDFSSNLRVHELHLFLLEDGHLDRLRNVGSVTKLQVTTFHISTLYPLMEFIGPRGLEALSLSCPLDPDSTIDLCRLFAVAPKLSSLKFDSWPHCYTFVIESPTVEQLQAIDFERLRRLRVYMKSPCNNSLPFLEQLVLRAESLEELYVESDQVELVLQLLRVHPECCTRVSKLFLGESQNLEEVLEVATRIALRSPILKLAKVSSLGGARERIIRDFPWFPRLCSSNDIDF